MRLCFCCLKAKENDLNMYLYQEKTGWNTLRLDSRTYTARMAREQDGELIRRIPSEYLFIDDKCFMSNGRIKEVVLPSHCRIIGKQVFEGCSSANRLFFQKHWWKSKKEPLQKIIISDRLLFPLPWKKSERSVTGNATI